MAPPTAAAPSPPIVAAQPASASLLLAQAVNGLLVHGHIRRYPQSNYYQRDVGRRAVQALVVLTRYPGGEKKLYHGLLKGMEW